MRSPGRCRRRRTWNRAGSLRQSRRWRGRCSLGSGITCRGCSARLGPLAGVCDLGGESDHLAQVGDGAVEIALVPVRAAAVVVSKAANDRLWMGGFELGSEPDRLAVVGDGAVEIAPVLVRVAPVVVGGCKLGIEPDRRAVVGDGAVEIALVPVSDAA